MDSAIEKYRNKYWFGVLTGMSEYRWHCRDAWMQKLSPTKERQEEETILKINAYIQALRDAKNITESEKSELREYFLHRRN